ncbi:hypothetical protein [Rhizobium sp. BR 362]|uniref:hypothetical protein n=1 Tax=Rhizobium sp. BR 362 TaxID=3040670 RepID=UPI002F3FE250
MADSGQIRGCRGVKVTIFDICRGNHQHCRTSKSTFAILPQRREAVILLRPIRSGIDIGDYSPARSQRNDRRESIADNAVEGDFGAGETSAICRPPLRGEGMGDEGQQFSISRGNP